MTTGQQQVLSFVREFVKEQGVFPLYKEVLYHFGWKSTHSVTTVFKALHRMGFLEYDGGYSLARCCPYCESEVVT